jgi:hypothetical protein
MKTVIKIAILLLVLNAAARVGFAAWHYFQLRDEARQIATFGGGHSETELHNLILEKAAVLDVPLEPQGLTVRREGLETIIEAAYTQPVQLVPKYYTYPVNLNFTVNAIVMKPVTPDDVLR